MPAPSVAEREKEAMRQSPSSNAASGDVQRSLKELEGRLDRLMELIMGLALPLDQQFRPAILPSPEALLQSQATTEPQSQAGKLQSQATVLQLLS